MDNGCNLGSDDGWLEGMLHGFRVVTEDGSEDDVGQKDGFDDGWLEGLLQDDSGATCKLGYWQ